MNISLGKIATTTAIAAAVFATVTATDANISTAEAAASCSGRFVSKNDRKLDAGRAIRKHVKKKSRGKKKYSGTCCIHFDTTNKYEVRKYTNGVLTGTKYGKKSCKYSSIDGIELFNKAVASMTSEKPSTVSDVAANTNAKGLFSYDLRAA